MVKWSSGLLCHRGKQFYTLASIVRLHADADGCSQMDDRTDGPDRHTLRDNAFTFHVDLLRTQKRKSWDRRGWGWGSSGRSYSIGIIRWTLLRFVRVVIVYVGDT